MAKPEEIEVLVSHEDFVAALRALVPSVSQSEMEHYAAVQQKFAGETINAVKKDKGKGKEKAIQIEFDSH
jgi:peroxin-6